MPKKVGSCCEKNRYDLTHNILFTEDLFHLLFFSPPKTYFSCFTFFKFFVELKRKQGSFSQIVRKLGSEPFNGESSSEKSHLPRILETHF